MAFVKNIAALMFLVFLAVKVQSLDLNLAADELEEFVKELREETAQKEARGFKEDLEKKVDEETVKQLATLDRKALEKLADTLLAEAEGSKGLIKDVGKIRAMSDAKLREYLRPKVDGKIDTMLSKLNKRDLELVHSDRDKRFLGKIWGMIKGIFG